MTMLRWPCVQRRAPRPPTWSPIAHRALGSSAVTTIWRATSLRWKAIGPSPYPANRSCVSGRERRAPAATISEPTGRSWAAPWHFARVSAKPLILRGLAAAIRDRLSSGPEHPGIEKDKGQDDPNKRGGTMSSGLPLGRLSVVLSKPFTMSEFVRALQKRPARIDRP